MPKLMVTANVPLIDIDGVDHRLGKEINVWGDLTEAQQVMVTALMARIGSVLRTKYGATAVIEGVKYLA